MKQSFILLFSFLTFISVKAECRKDTVYYYSFSLYDTEKYLDSRIINTYDNNNNLLEIIGENWNSSGLNWVKASKKSFTYDGSNNQLTQIDASWNNTAYVNQKKYTWLYDANKNQIQQIYQSWDLATNAWVNGTKNDNTYNANHQILQTTSYTWNAATSSWKESTRSTYTYDGNGNNTILQVDGWKKTKNNWAASTKTTNTFVGNNLTVKLYQLADSFGNYFNRQKFEFTYDASNNPIEQIAYFGTGNLAISGKFLYQYDANHLKTQEIKQNYIISTSTFVNNTKTNSLYNANKTKIADYYEVWDANKAQWLKSGRDSFEFNIDNDQTGYDSKYNYSYAYNAYTGHTRQAFKCTHLINTTGLAGINDANNLQVFPNPSLGEFSIQSDKTIQAYKIFNAFGQLVVQQTPNDKAVKITLEENGIYFIQIHLGNEMVTRKIIIQK